MSNIQFSLVMPSVRPQLWSRFVNSIKDTTISWEVVCVGDKAPVCSLPSNFRWIKSSVKPSQATHIGFLEAKGEIMSLTADDANYFCPPKFGHFPGNAIDNMYFYMKNFGEGKIFNKSFKDSPKRLVYGFRMFEDHPAIESTWTHRLNYYIKHTSMERFPLLFPFFAIFKETYLKYDGYDNRFITGQAENDFQMRIARNVHTDTALCPMAMVHALHDVGHQNSGKFREYYHRDRQTLLDLWGESGEFMTLERHELRVHKYINNSSIYTTSQGNKGEWK